MLNQNIANCGVVILAAGRGSRLGCTDIPKVMLELNGKPMVEYTVETLFEAGFTKEQIVLVVGYQQEVVREYFGDKVTYAEQKVQHGTADAAFRGMARLPDSVSQVLVLGGDDSAFYTASTLRNFMQKHLEEQTFVSLLSCVMDEPANLGRIVRRENGEIEVIEKEYTTDEQKLIKEVSTGTYCFNREWFNVIFPTMPPLRKLGEYVLPTVLAMARDQKRSYQIVEMGKSDEWFGINTPEQLAEAEKRKQ